MDLLKILGSIQAFKGLKEKELAQLIPLLEEEHYPAGTKIIREGAMGDSMYIIISGSVKVIKAIGTSQEFAINQLERDDYFGELALIDNLPRSASVVSRESSVILRLRKTAFDKLIENNSEIARNFYKNCLLETFSRYRKLTTDITFFRHDLKEKKTVLEEITRDLTSAKKLQDFFINARTLDHRKLPIKGFRQSFIYNPTQEIGGDFINLTPFSETEYGAVIADVMGHGITAALATGAFKSAYALLVKKYGQNPVELLKRLNRHFFEDISSLFASCFYAFINLDKNQITMARAGHYFPLFYDAKKSNLVSTKTLGPALGIIENALFEEILITFEAGDKLLFYTDGIIEQRNQEGKMYTEERLKQKFLEFSRQSGSDILKLIEVDFDLFCNSCKREDDISLLLLEFN